MYRILNPSHRLTHASRRSLLLAAFVCLSLLALVWRGWGASAVDRAQSASAGCVTPPAGVVAWYPGDANANDISGSGNDGTPKGGATFAPGMIGQAFSLNGSDAYVEAPPNAAQDPTAAGTEEAWVFFNQLPSAAGHIMEVIGKGGSGTDFDLQVHEDNHFYFYVGGGNQVSSNTVIQTGFWYHVAGTWDATGLRVYVNGVLENTNPVQNLTRGQSNLPLQIGNQPFFGPRLFNGLIDEPQIFGRALSQSEVQSIFNAGGAGQCKTPSSCVAPPTGMAAWYRFEEGGLDYSGNNNHGALSGSYSFGAGEVSQGLQVTDGGARVPDAASLRPASAVTVEGWVKAGSSPGAFRYVAAKLYDTCTSSYGLYTGASGGLSFYVRTGADCFAFTRSPDAGTKVWDGQFHHVAGTYDGSTVRLFVDGVEQDGGTPASGPILYQSTVAGGDLFIGRPTFAGQNFNGAIDELTIYNRALSQAEIRGVAGAGSAGKCAAGATPTPTPTPAATPTPSPTPTPVPVAFYTISGKVKNSAGAPLAGVGIQLSGTDRVAFTNGVGFYELKSLAGGGNYTLIASRPGVDFQPAALTLNNLSGDQTHADFTGNQTQFTIAGRILITNFAGGLQNAGLGGITVQLEGSALRSVTTDSAGFYAFRNLPAGNFYRLKASHPNFKFTPAEYTFNTLTQDQLTANFTATSLVPSHDGRVAFISGNDVYLMGGDGSGVTNLTYRGPINPGAFWTQLKGAPAFSSDGNQIAFMAFGANSATWELWAMNYDGGNLHRVTTLDNVGQRGLSWIQSDRILFAKSSPDTGLAPAIYSIKPDGTNLTPISRNANQYEPDYAGETSLFPEHITFRQEGGGAGIYTMNPDGTNVTRIIQDVNVPASLPQLPAWNPEATTGTALLAYLDTAYGYIYTLENVTGSRGVRLARADSKPAWDPGLRIFYSFGSGIFSVTAPTIQSHGGLITQFPVTGHDPAATANKTLDTMFSKTGGTESTNGAGPEGATVSSGNVTVNFGGVQSAGQTTIDPISPASVLPLPDGYAGIIGPALAYQIDTTASFTPPVTTCINVPSVDDEAVFNSLRILHGEGGVLVDRTVLSPDSPAPDYSARSLCAGTTTLGTFVVVQKADAGLPSINGIVRDGNGDPLSDVTVVLSGDRTSATQTDVDGQFQFVNIPPGGNYKVTPVSSAFSFTPRSANLINLQAGQGAAFTATACALSLSSGSISVGRAAATGSFNVNAAAGGCGWTATPDSPWITITSPGVGGGPGAVQYSLGENTAGSTRSGLIYVNGEVFRITQTATDKPIDDTTFYVRQHYLDFLGREPDPSGLDFWAGEINSCGTDQQCVEVKRINVSAAFFLSLEFQNTGYLVERTYKAAFGDATGTSTFGGTHQLPVPIVRFGEFLSDTQRIGDGVVVLQPGWEEKLESNKQAFAAEFVRRPTFTAAFATTMTPAQFVDKLNQNAGSVLSAGERQTAIDLFGGASDTSNLTARAQALRQVAEDSDLQAAEFNRAFVLMEYFGYLRRNPNNPQDADYTGYDFWLRKLNQFDGNYINAELVKAFITSIEYRQRFGPS